MMANRAQSCLRHASLIASVILIAAGCSSVPDSVYQFSGPQAACMHFVKAVSSSLATYDNQCSVGLSTVVCRGSSLGIRQCFVQDVKPLQKAIYVQREAYQLDACSLRNYRVEPVGSGFVPTWAVCNDDPDAQAKIAGADTAWYKRMDTAVNAAASVAPYATAAVDAKTATDQDAKFAKSIGTTINRNQVFDQNFAAGVRTVTENNTLNAIVTDETSWNRMRQAIAKVQQDPDDSNALGMCHATCDLVAADLKGRCTNSLPDGPDGSVDRSISNSCFKQVTDNQHWCHGSCDLMSQFKKTDASAGVSQSAPGP